MAITGTLTLDGVLLGLASGSKRVFLAWTVASGVGQISQPLTLASGDNTITVPTGTTLVVFVPPVANANALLLKGAGGDTGVSLNKTQPTLLAWGAVGSLIINAAGSTAGCEISFV